MEKAVPPMANVSEKLKHPKGSPFANAQQARQVVFHISTVSTKTPNG